MINLDLGIVWYQENLQLGELATGGEFTLHQLVDGYWGPLPRHKDEPVIDSNGRVYIARTMADRVSERRGYIPATTPGTATVSVKYGITVRTGPMEDVIGGTVYCKVDVLVSMPCSPNEVDAVRQDVSDYVGRVIQQERDDIYREYHIPSLSLLADEKPDTGSYA